MSASSDRSAGERVVREARHIAIAIACPFEKAYALAHRPENFTRWAAGLADTLSFRDGNWIAQTPAGEAVVNFSPPNAFGILDHGVLLPDGTIVDVPMRMLSNGDATEVVFTLFRQPAMDDAAFARDARLVERDLAALKSWLETSEPD